jgi:hypothetical protein
VVVVAVVGLEERYGTQFVLVVYGDLDAGGIYCVVVDAHRFDVEADLGDFGVDFAGFDAHNGLGARHYCADGDLGDFDVDFVGLVAHNGFDARRYCSDADLDDFGVDFVGLVAHNGLDAHRYDVGVDAGLGDLDVGFDVADYVVHDLDVDFVAHVVDAVAADLVGPESYLDAGYVEVGHDLESDDYPDVGAGVDCGVDCGVEAFAALRQS